MIRTDNFITFYFKRLLENKTNDKLPLYFSERFRNILFRINDEISRKLINSENENDITSIRTYIDIDESSNDKISFIMVNKIKDALNINKNDDVKLTANDITSDQFKDIFKSRLRSTIKINRFITEIFGDLYTSKTLTEEEKKYNREHGIKTGAQKLEDFVNKFKSYREPSKFELVDGNDIVYWYNKQNYSNMDGSLGNSCMSYDRCGDYIEFYAKNKGKVSLLILKDREDENKIIGRALVWNLSIPEDRIFMDRIYTNNDFDVDSFKQYAKNNGWLYKYNQNMYSDTQIVDTKTGESKFMNLYVHNVVDNDYYPYMDTLKYYSDKTLQNTEEGLDNYELLEDTYGGSRSRNVYTYDQLVDMYTDDILNDFKYYAMDYFPNLVWDYVDDDRFLSDFLIDEISSYEDNIEDLVDEDDLVKFLKDYKDYDITIQFLKQISDEDEDEDEHKDLSDLTKNELMLLIDKLETRYDFTRYYMENRYDGYTAKEILEELYGPIKDNYLTSDIYYRIEQYIDKEECAIEYASNESEDWLRERYED